MKKCSDGSADQDLERVRDRSMHATQEATAPMPPSVRQVLLALQDRDAAVRAELEADGVLFDGYHPRMEQVHRENAAQLRILIDRHGWPHEHVAGRDAAEAAWLIAQHAIGEPGFMRRCRDLLEKEVAAGTVPQWQFAYLDDRIRVSEGRLQRFGTQFELTPAGPVLCPTADPDLLDQRRHLAGLGPIAEHLQRMRSNPRPTLGEYEAKRQAELQWRLRVGWIASSDG